MSDTTRDLQEALHRFISNRQTITVFPATVTAVNESARTCDVTDGEDLELYDVRLRAAIDSNTKGFVAIPKVGSAVLVGNIGNSPNAYFVVMFSEVTKVFIQVDNTRLQVDGTGTLIQREEQTLKIVLNSLIDQIKLITVTCAAPGSPSTVPLNVAALDAIKTQVDTLLN